MVYFDLKVYYSLKLQFWKIFHSNSYFKRNENDLSYTIVKLHPCTTSYIFHLQDCSRAEMVLIELFLPLRLQMQLIEFKAMHCVAPTK